MEKKIFRNLSVKDLLFSVTPVTIFVIALLIFAYRHLDPAPPDHLTISTGADEGELQEYAKQYQEILKQDGVRLDVVSSQGPLENLQRLENDNSGVPAGFVPDGLGSEEEQPDIVSLGSLYYEPMWIFYRGSKELTHLSQLDGKRIAVGQVGRGTHIIAVRLLQRSGVDIKTAKLLDLDSTASAAALQKGEIDAAMLLLPADDKVVQRLVRDKSLRLMDIDQAEAIARQDASFHHLVLPRGALDLKDDLPRADVDLIASTTTLLVRDDLHPALAYLMLKAASQVHSEPGLFEKRGEFPTNKDDQFALSDDAKQFYKSGGPFWQRYLPFWLAAWFDRFVLLVIPTMAIVIPLLKQIPRFYKWRIRTRIYRHYGELKHLETKIVATANQSDWIDYEKQLDALENRVNVMKVPLEFSEYIYSLRGHIHFVRERLAEAYPQAAHAR